MPQIQRHKHQLAAKHRRQMHAFANVLDNRLVKAAFEACWQFAQIEGADMHRHFGRFKVQKSRVQSGQ